MKNIYILGSIVVLALFLMTACTDTNTNSNSNRSASNSTTNTVMNSVANTANKVTNTISNAAAKLTTASANDFLKAAGQGGMAEVELGKLAVSKAQNPEVKKFGQLMVDDHGKANTELKALAGMKNIPVPADLGSRQSTIDKLKGLSGADFDKAYVDDMVSDHETDVKEFEEQSEKADDADVKAFAAKTLPVLKKHLDAIKAIQAKMK